MFNSSYFHGKSHFEHDGTQKYLVFLPVYIWFKMIGNINYILAWKSKGLSYESIHPLLHLIIALLPCWISLAPKYENLMDVV